MFFPWKCWLLTFAVIMILLVCAFLVLPLLPVLPLYVDDTSIVSCSYCTARALFSVYALFGRGTGAKLNLGKCRRCLVEFVARPSGCAVPIKWTIAMIKVLGIYLRNGNLEIIGCPELMRSRNVRIPGVADPYPSLAKL